MKILQLGKFYPIRGGVEKVMWDLTRGISGRGVDCDMLCAMLPADGFDPRKPVVAEFNAHGRVICVKAILKLAATMISPAMVFWLRRHAGEYDIIHIHHPDPMACLALRMSGFRGRVILHWHSDILKQKGLLVLYRPLQRWLIRRASVIVGTTPVYVRQSPDLISARHKITYLPIGIEDSVYSPSESDDDTVTVFSLGRLVEYKGFSYLIEAAALLPDNYRVKIAGKGPLEGELRSLAERTAPGKVEILGYVTDEEARRLYNDCSVFVLSSVMKTEAFGIVQLEAMSCRKPVIATHIPGSGTDWVNADGVSGINVPCCDSAALARAIRDVCEDPERYRRYCSDARERYESLFSYEGMVDGALDIYTERSLYRPLLSVLAASLDRSKTVCLPSGAAGWDFLYYAAGRHAVQGVVMDGILGVESDDRHAIPSSLAHLWLTDVRRIEEANRRIEAIVSKQRDTWSRRGIGAILLKGLETARFYPVPRHRVNGDIDWWMPSAKDWNAAINVLKDNKIEWTVDSDGDISYELAGVVVEHHRKGLATPSPTPESTLLLLSGHILHHAMVTGAGLRQLYDYAAALKSLDGFYDRDLYAELLRARHLTRWNEVLEGLIAKSFYAESGDEARLLQLILEDGNFGLDKPGRFRGLWKRARLFMKIAPRPFVSRWLSLMAGRLRRPTRSISN